MKSLVEALTLMVPFLAAYPAWVNLLAGARTIPFAAGAGRRLAHGAERPSSSPPGKDMRQGCP